MNLASTIVTVTPEEVEEGEIRETPESVDMPALEFKKYVENESKPLYFFTFRVTTKSGRVFKYYGAKLGDTDTYRVLVEPVYSDPNAPAPIATLVGVCARKELLRDIMRSLANIGGKRTTGKAKHGRRHHRTHRRGHYKSSAGRRRSHRNV